MSLRVIAAPDPILTPSEVSADYSDGDAIVNAWISAAQGEIDGPNGMLGIAVGPQTLELQLSEFPVWNRVSGDGIRLPCAPIISIEGFEYTDSEGDLVVLEPSEWHFQPGTEFIYPALNTSWPTALDREGSVRIRYCAGYDGDGESGTGEIPPAIKQAMVLLVNHYVATGQQNLFLSEVTVQGVGTRRYVVSEAAGTAMRDAFKNLLAGYRRTFL